MASGASSDWFVSYGQTRRVHGSEIFPKYLTSCQTSSEMCGKIILLSRSASCSSRLRITAVGAAGVDSKLVCTYNRLLLPFAMDHSHGAGFFQKM